MQDLLKHLGYSSWILIYVLIHTEHDETVLPSGAMNIQDTDDSIQEIIQDEERDSARGKIIICNYNHIISMYVTNSNILQTKYGDIYTCSLRKSS